MKNDESKTLPPLAFMVGTKATTLPSVVGTPKREYAELFVPGKEALEDGELRVAMLFAELGETCQGPVLQCQDPTVVNLTKEAIVSRQAKVQDQLPPIAGKQRATFQPVHIPPPEWWAEALIPSDRGVKRYP